MRVDANGIEYRHSCRKCEYEDTCYFCGYDKMFKKRCYIDHISKKMKVKSQTVLKYAWDFYEHFNGHFPNYAIESYIKDCCINEDGQNRWLSMTEPEKRDEIAWHYDADANDTKLMVAMGNTFYNAWRNEDRVRCCKCGKWIDNNSRHNRKYCEDCKGRDEHYRTAICTDCGCRFTVDSTKNSRQYRCDDCQYRADKESARLRAKRYRDRKKSSR